MTVLLFPCPSGLTQAHLQCAEDTASEVDAQVAARILTLEAEHKVELSLLQTELKEKIELLKIENRNLQEKLQHETHLREDLESVSSPSAGLCIFAETLWSVCLGRS